MALDDEKGSIRATNFKYALCAGLLAELVLEGRVTLERGSETVERPDHPCQPETPVGSAAGRGPAEGAGFEEAPIPKDWVSKFSAISALRKRVGTGLVRRSILRERNVRVFLLFSLDLLSCPGPGSKASARGTCTSRGSRKMKSSTTALRSSSRWHRLPAF